MVRRPRSSKPNFASRMLGHTFGVMGAIMGLNAIATSIDPRYLQLFPFSDTGIQQTPAALIGVGLIALAAWLVAERSPRAKAKIDPPETR